MESMTNATVWTLLVVALLVGILGGFVATYLWQNRRSRTKLLQAELEQTRAEMEAYREKVNQHFQKTAELFEEMTDKYRAVYQHLASSSQDLCGEQPPALQHNPNNQPRLSESPAASTPQAEPETPASRTDDSRSESSGQPPSSDTSPRNAAGGEEEDEDTMLGKTPPPPKAPEYERYLSDKLH